MHKQSYRELARAMLWFFGAIALGIAILIVVNMIPPPQNGNKIDPQAIFWVGVALIGCACLLTLPWVVPAALRFGQNVALHERGISVHRRGDKQELPFDNVAEVSESIEFHQWLPDATRVHTLTIKPEQGRKIVLASGAVANFESLRNHVIAGVTAALAPKLADLLMTGRNKRLPTVLLTKHGVLLDRTVGARGQLVRWHDLEGVGIHPDLGHVLLKTHAGVIDTKAWMVGIPHWFLLPALADEMQRRLNTQTA